MAYIGKTPVIGNFQKCDAITVVNGQAAYTMQVGGTNVSPESENHMLVSLNGILQAPVDSFTVSGSTITFASNLQTGDVIDFIMLLGNVLDLGVPSDNTVSLAKLTATGTKDATTFLRGDNTFATVSSDYVKLATSTMSADSTVSFDGYFSSTYKNYKIIINDVTFSTNDTNLRMRYRQSNADVSTSNYGAVGQTGGIDIGTGSLNQTINNTNNDSFRLTNTSDATSASNVNLQGEVTLYNPLNSTEYKMYNHKMVYFGTSATGNFYTLTGGGWFKGNTTALSGFTLFPHQGTFSGSVTLYGIK